MSLNSLPLENMELWLCVIISETVYPALNNAHVKNMWYLQASQICGLFVFIGLPTAAMMDNVRKFTTTLAEDEWCSRPSSDQK